MAKKASLKDIANKAGVSIALVSYVLNGKNTSRINKETAIRIKEIAHEFNYQPNQIAKSLKNKKTNTIGLIVADISNFFYSYITGHIEEEANKYGYNVFFGSAYEDPDRFKDLLELMVSRQVDGLILAIPDGAESNLAYIKDLSIPYLLIDREFPEYGDFNTISLDNFKSSEMVVEKLVSLGKKRIAAFGLDNNLYHLNERNKGFIETANKYLNPNEVFLFRLSENDLFNDAKKALNTALFDYKVDAICCFTNKISMEMLPMLLALNIKIPEDLVIISYDEVDAYKLFPYPMFYVRQPLKEMSIKAVKQLLDPKEIKPLINLKFQAELIEMKGY